MRNKLLWLMAALVLAAGLLAWSPWLSMAGARSRAEGQFERAWQGVADGCGFNCQGCGAVSAVRLPFGYRVDLEYACGLLPEDSPRYHQRAAVYVSPLGSVHGLNAP